MHAAAPVFRFAPSPTGALHLGHARSALLNAALAKRCGGRFLVRIEDIDPTRQRPGAIEAIVADLAWLGLDVPKPILHQSTRMKAYAAGAEQLTGMGLLYPCFASRAEIQLAAVPGRFDPDGAPLYPGIWRKRTAADITAAHAAGLPVAYRLDMARALARLDRPLSFRSLTDQGVVTETVCDPARWGDVVLLRKETPTSYHLAVVIDDAYQAISHVVRGMDLLAATDLHRLLQHLLGLPAPLYHHHALITDRDGRKLSKSASDTSLAALRASGLSAFDVAARAMAGLAIPEALV